MSKGNLFLGYARGKVGDVVFSRSNGEQVTRARNRAPRNPQTAVQLLQRSVMKSNSLAYSMMSEICDHSFQGIVGATPNQSEFAKVNVAMLRAKCADALASGDPSDILFSDAYNFAGKSDVLPPINEYIVSRGTIPAPAVEWRAGATEGQGLLSLSDAQVSTEGTTHEILYSELVNFLGLQQGDQITVLALTANDQEGEVESVFNGFHVGRFICEPSDGDMSANVFDLSKFNARNENVTVRAWDDDESLLALCPASTMGFAKGGANTIVAMAYIVSRQSGGVWQRSSAKLVVRPSGAAAWHMSSAHFSWFLGDAVQSFMTAQSSSLYLNQAE